MDGGAAAEVPDLRPEHLDEESYATIWALMAKGRLSVDVANDRWPPRERGWPRLLARLAVGAAVWSLALVGLWSILN